MKTSAVPVPVFLVEDIRIIRQNLVEALEEVANARVVASAEGQREAVDWLAAHPLDWTIAAIDLFLREGSGLGVLEACKNRRPYQRAVVLTNYATPDVRSRCLALGADAIYDKSTELEAFLSFCKKHAGVTSEDA